MPKKPITDAGYATISHYEWNEQVAERERRFRPRVEALGKAGTETLTEVLDYIVGYKRAKEGAKQSAYYMAARAGFNALCRFMGIPIGKFQIYNTHEGGERGQFWEWCWEISENRRVDTAWQPRLELGVPDA